MRVFVNGEPRVLPDHADLDTVVPDRRGVAVAVNGAVVPATDWARTVLREDDRVEVVTAHQGG
jgi:sulfur carrier protein